MSWPEIELNIMFIWINCELAVLIWAFFGVKIKRGIRKWLKKH
jgi:hypothetical protein